MKTPKMSLIFFLVLPLFFVTCKKELSTPASTSTTFTPAGQTAGAIVDLGVVDPDVHHMIVSLNDVSLTLNGQPLNGEVASSMVNIDLYTNTDAVISDGTYSFSNDTNYQPFTFKSASILMPNTDGNSSQTYSLSGGSISLVRNGTSYSISMDGVLETGNNFQGSFSGELSYSDAVQNTATSGPTY